MYPKGVNDEERHCGIFLCLIDSRRVKASFSICVKDQINNTLQYKRTEGMLKYSECIFASSS